MFVFIRHSCRHCHPTVAPYRLCALSCTFGGNPWSGCKKPWSPSTCILPQCPFSSTDLGWINQWWLHLRSLLTNDVIRLLWRVNFVTILCIMIILLWLSFVIHFQGFLFVFLFGSPRSRKMKIVFYCCQLKSKCLMWLGAQKKSICFVDQPFLWRIILQSSLFTVKIETVILV